MPKVRKAKKPRTGKAPKTQSERLERSGKSNPLKSKYKRKKKVTCATDGTGSRRNGIGHRDDRTADRKEIHRNRGNQKTQDSPPDVCSGLFGEQINLLGDESRMKAAVCSRRAGKTWAVTRAMIKACLARPNALVGYLTKTRDWAEELVWEPLQSISERQHLYGDFNNAKLRCVFPNKSKIRLAGAKDKAQTEVLRGFAYDLLVIDEAGSIDPVIMRYVVKEILPAALGDHRGTLLVVGTPNESCSGYFHDITNGKQKWRSVHHWVQRQNVMFPRWAHIKDEPARLAAVEEYLAEERATYHLAESDPEYRREYLGIWAKNEELFIYRISEDNLAPPPEEDLRYILAIDLGWHDMTAFELLGMTPTSRNYTKYTALRSST